MSMNHVFRSESDVVTARPVTIEFEFKDLSSLPEGKTIGNRIVITPLKTRTWFKIKPLLLSIDKEDFSRMVVSKDQSFGPEAAGIMAKYDDLLLDVVCLGIHNKKSDPPTWFRDVLKDNCTWEDIYILLNAILFRLYSNPFLNSITALKTVSPLEEREIIALRKNKEKWECKAPSCS